MQLYMRFWRVKVKALLDSGATENFIHPRMVKKMKLQTRLLKKPRQVKNVDGSPNKAGEVMEVAILEIRHKGYRGNHAFFVAEVDHDNILLGYPFLEAVNPEINWRSGKIYGAVTLKGTLKADMSKIARTTMVQQLVEAATDKKVRLWTELVPKEYHRHEKIFSEKESERLPQHGNYDHSIELKPNAPATINCRMYPMSPKEDVELDKFVDENLRLQRIVQTDSPYASGFFFIKKKEGTLRPVQDYRKLNKWTVPSQYPLPLIEDIVHKFAGKEWFSKFNVRWGYNNRLIKEEDQWKAAFKMKRGLFKPKVMFFGLCNSPATFQKFMDDAFHTEIDSGDYGIYMDDVLVATNGTIEEHIKKVHHILDKMRENDLFLKPTKCTFHKREIDYLGLIIGNGKVHMDPVKVQGIVQWPAPTTIKGIRSFLGFCNFYRAFIPKFLDITHSLNDLTKKNQQWQWRDKEQEAFDELKCICVTQPVLCAPDWNKQ